MKICYGTITGVIFDNNLVCIEPIPPLCTYVLPCNRVKRLAGWNYVARTVFPLHFLALRMSILSTPLSTTIDTLS